MIPVIFSTGSLYTYSIERCFRFAKAAGCDGIELMVDHRAETHEVDYLQGLIQGYGLPILTVHNPFDMAKLAGWPADKPGRIARSVALAEALGAKTVVHHLPSKIDILALRLAGRRLLLPWFNGGQRAYKDWLAAGYGELQSRTDVKLCMENMPTRRFLGRPLDAHHWNRPDQLGQHPHLPYLTLDTTHLATWGIEPVEVYEQFNGKVHHIHLSNFDGREHRRPEEGDLNLTAFLKKLTATNFPGAVSLELHPDALDGGEPDEVIIEHLRGSVAFCREALN
ncbi:MAG: sugar phosphate isomerase/epimerase [Anaerolineales bacterium]|nr:sugar phosphate isomerase/epimerase [Anaerolineales bacterium]